MPLKCQQGKALTHNEVYDSIDEHLDPLTDKDLIELTKSANEEEGEEDPVRE